MIYNFSSKIVLSPGVLETLIPSDGVLQTAGELKVLTQIQLNTVLSDEGEANLISVVNAYLASLGHDETILVSKE